MINVAAFVYTPGGEGSAYDGPWARPATGAEAAQHYTTWDLMVSRILKVNDTLTASRCFIH